MSNNKQLYIDFEAYERMAEPHKQEKASAWRTAIGLQDVDGLKVSDYLRETAVRHIEGDITIDDVRERLKFYYINKTTHDKDDEEKEEADRVAANIAKLLNEKSFSFTALEFLNIHRHLFEGVFKHAGEVRTYDISKKEWVLQDDSVVYGRAADIMMALRYDIQQEKEFNYKGLTTDEIIEHIVDFVTLLWQNHPFREGNTRTTAVFVIKYLRSIGFKVNNDLFANNSWYFRNALVRANYRNPLKGIEPNKSFLIKFFRNLILEEQNELKNRYMLIGYQDDCDTHTSTHTSTNNSVSSLSENVKRLVIVIGTEEKGIKEMMDAVGLRNRPNFIEYSLTPAINGGLVTMKYPDSPRHPRQKYLLTVKGLAVYNEFKEMKK
ncbi:Fic family protein [Leyella stercorea]|uniref:Fic family protein n=1 Tax=Leyella stercorea TaxID=363265 RepID=UPI00267106E0|nr:Fic family protein [Leyella stercorea]